MAEKNNGREIAFVETYEEEIKNAIIEVKVTSADGREYNTNMKLTQSDLDLFAQIRSMN